MVNGKLAVRCMTASARAACMALVTLLAFAVALLCPATASADIGAYSIDELSTEIYVETNGTAHVIERQVYTFDDRNGGCVWYLHVPESGESVRISSIRVVPVDDGGTPIGDWTTLNAIDVDRVPQGTRPGDTAVSSLRSSTTRPWYSYSIGDGMVRCFFPTWVEKPASSSSSSSASAGSGSSEAERSGQEADAQAEQEPQASDGAPQSDAAAEPVPDGDAATEGQQAAADSGEEGASSLSAVPDAAGMGETAVSSVSTATETTNTYLIETDYTIQRRVRVYRDVAELYWRYANSDLPVDAHDVNLHITLPVPADAGPIVLGETVIAWGHGPDGGTIEVAEDGTITCHIDQVPQGNYAEAHVIFPASWMTNLSAEYVNQFTSVRADEARAEEAEWVDSSMRGAIWDYKVRVLFLAIALAVIAAGAIGVARNRGTSRSRRALVRTSVTLGIIALGEHLFFHEPLTTAILVGAAIVVALVALYLTEPGEDEEDYDVEAEDEAESQDVEHAADGEGETL